MINASTAFKTKIANDERDYIIGITITLINNTVLTIDNTEIASGGLSIEEAVGSDNNFDALGGVVINKCTLILSNIERDFTQYNFQGAKIVVSIGLEIGTSTETIRKGVYIVDEAKYSDWTVTLTALDRMALFDVPYSNCNTTYPATLLSIVQDICSTCGVVLGTVNFPYYTDIISTRPTTETITCRQVLSWVAQMVGCYAYIGYDNINVPGQLKFGWFDISTLNDEFEDLDINFPDTSVIISNPVSTIGRPIYYTTGISSTDIDVDDIVITGVRVNTKNPATDTNNKLLSKLQGSTGYVIEIPESNELISSTNYISIAQRLGNQLNGVTFRRVNLTALNNPLIQAGDVAITYDRKYAFHRILITRTVFNPFGYQDIICGAESPVHNGASSYSSATKSYVQMRKITDPEFGYLKSQQEALQEELDEAVASMGGLYETVDNTSSGDIIYLHDKPLLDDSSAVLKITDSAIAVTPNYEDGPDANWYGITFDGVFIANIVSTMSAFFNYAHGGTLKLGGSGNGNGILQVVDANNNEIGRWNNNGIQMRAGFITLGGTTESPNFRVTTDGTVTIKQGSINIGQIGASSNYNFSVNSNGEVAIKSGSISLGTTTISGTSYPAFYVNDSGDFRLRKGAINLGDGNFIVTTAGVVTIKEGSIQLGQIGTSSDYNFTVNSNGKLVARDATINGTVRSESSVYVSNYPIWAEVTDGGVYGGYRPTTSSSSLLSRSSGMLLFYSTISTTNDDIELGGKRTIYISAARDIEFISGDTYHGETSSSNRYIWATQYNNRGTVLISSASTNATRVLDIQTNTSGGYRYFYFYNFSGSAWAIEVPTSDENLKTNIKESKVSALDIINKIEHKQFEYKDGGECANGYVAQQLEEINPDFVYDVPQKSIDNTNSKKGDNEEPETIKHVRTFEILSYATKAIQELSAKVDELEARIAELERERGENR